MDYEKESQASQKFKINYLFPLLFAIILVVGILIGMLIGGNTEVIKPSFFTKADHDKVEEILNYVNNRYVDSVNSKELFNLAIDEIFKHLDPHSVYITAETLKDVNESLEGEFEGIGVEFFILNDTIVVVTPLINGPSEKVGIQSGDRIVMIEDTAVAGVSITSQDVVNKLKGPSGSDVKIAIWRHGADTLMSFNIVRGPVKLTSVDAAYMMDNEVAFVKINKFSSTTHEEFKDALVKLKKQGMRKLVLDLRDNGGGYLEAATRVADELLSGRKLIVYMEGRSYPKKNYKAHVNGEFEDGDMVVLINENSASASEILAGALQDWNRALLMGRRSYGKALVQDQIKLQDGSAMRLTIARYYTPKGRSIQRPYENGVDAYYEDYLNRVISEYEKPDSFKSTDSAEWGIKPTIYLSHDTSAGYSLVVKLINRGVIPKFAYYYYDVNKDIFSGYSGWRDFMNNYEMDDASYDKFLKFIEREKEPFLADDLKRNAFHVKTALKAYLSKQVYHYDAYYPIMNQLDHEVKAAYSKIKSPQLIKN